MINVPKLSREDFEKYCGLVTFIGQDCPKYLTEDLHPHFECIEWIFIRSVRSFITNRGMHYF